jgi:hypothetical protein
MDLRTPSVVWDVSFQLAFAASPGIMLYAFPFSNFLTNLSARIHPHQRAEYLLPWWENIFSSPWQLSSPGLNWILQWILINAINISGYFSKK